MKDEFMALASHELRTPLTSVIGYLQLVLDGSAGPLNDRQRSHLEVVERRASQLAALVSDIHTLARADAGRMSLEPEPLDLIALVAETVGTHRPSADGRTIALELALPDEPVRMIGDRTRLAQVLDNLLSNALKFTGSGGTVRVTVERRGPHARLEVMDTGIGIAEDEQAGLFERFFRTRAVTERQIPGTGLGLAISRTIVEAHGGEIGLESRQGVGTTLRVTLPLAPAAPEPAGEPDDAAGDGRDRRGADGDLRLTEPGTRQAR
jgi:signal transduction histidine kinase